MSVREHALSVTEAFPWSAARATCRTSPRPVRQVNDNVRQDTALLIPIQHSGTLLLWLTCQFLILTPVPEAAPPLPTSSTGCKRNETPQAAPFCWNNSGGRRERLLGVCCRSRIPSLAPEVPWRAQKFPVDCGCRLHMWRLICCWSCSALCLRQNFGRCRPSGAQPALPARPLFWFPGALRPARSSSLPTPRVCTGRHATDQEAMRPSPWPKPYALRPSS